VTMRTAVKTVLSKYATFRGRARRSEYWYFALFQLIAYMVAGVLDYVIFGRQSLFSAIVGLGLLIPVLAVSVRRLHDTNRSGWWLFLSLVPFIGGVILLIWFCSKGAAEANRFGEDPTATDSLAPVI
jgi:uncharacterized membrane protein YhaH (DUF805 family)